MRWKISYGWDGQEYQTDVETTSADEQEARDKVWQWLKYDIKVDFEEKDVWVGDAVSASS